MTIKIDNFFYQKVWGILNTEAESSFGAVNPHVLKLDILFFSKIDINFVIDFILGKKKS